MSFRLLSRDFAFYGMLDLLRQALAVLLVPIYTRVLTQAEYGNLDMIITVFSTLTVIVDLQFLSGFSRFYLERRKTGDGPQLVGTTIATRVVLGTTVSALFLSLGFAGLLEFGFMPSFIGYSKCWILVALTVPLTFVFDLLLFQAQMLRKKPLFFSGSFGNTLLTTILCILFTVVVPLGIFGVLLGQFIGKCTLTAVLFYGLRDEISFAYHGEILAELARYTLPLVPGGWVGFSSAYVSRFFIYAEYGADENAVLAIATKVAGVLSLVTVAFRTAWQPLAMSYIGEKGGERFYILCLRVFMVAGVMGVFALSVLCGPMVSILAPPSYGAAELYVPFFLLAVLLGEVDFILQVGNQIAKKTHWMSIASIMALLVNVIALIALTRLIGIYAAAIGLLLSFVVKIAITYPSAQRNFRIRYDGRAAAVFATACSFLLALSTARAIGKVEASTFVALAVPAGVIFSWLTMSEGDRRSILDWILGKRMGLGSGATTDSRNPTSKSVKSRGPQAQDEDS